MVFLTATGEGDVPDHGSLHYLLGLNLPLDQDTAEGQESITARVNAIRNKLDQQVSKHVYLTDEDDVM